LFACLGGLDGSLIIREGALWNGVSLLINLGHFGSSTLIELLLPLRIGPTAITPGVLDDSDSNVPVIFVCVDLYTHIMAIFILNYDWLLFLSIAIIPFPYFKHLFKLSTICST
jgi:hypothetical protein